MSDFVNKPNKGTANPRKPEWIEQDLNDLRAKAESDPKKFGWFTKMSEAEQKAHIPKYAGELVVETESGPVQYGIKVAGKKNKNGGTYLSIETWLHKDQPYQDQIKAPTNEEQLDDFEDDIPF